MPIPDFRVSVDFWDHPKTIRAINSLGYEGVASLQRLWGFATKYRPKGVLSGMNRQDIALAAKAPDPELFVDCLVEIGFLEKHKNGVYKLHGWSERNGWVFYSPERSKRAANAAKTKHSKRHNELASAKSRFAQRNSGPPSPSPSPSPIPIPLAEPVTTGLGKPNNEKPKNGTNGYDPNSSEF